MAEYSVQIGAADRLPFDNGEIWSYRADKVFHELPNPARTLAETQPGRVPDG